MKNAQIGPLLLGGLITGPILGSGIIILPPLAYSIAGPWALPAWLIIMGVSMLFSWIFCRLSLLYPGRGGIATAVGQAFGGAAEDLTSLYLIGAVLFGPVAVMLTAGASLPAVHLPEQVLAMICTVVSCGILLCGVWFIGRVSLVCSSLVACTLFLGSSVTLISHGLPRFPGSGFSGSTFSYTLLLLFWSVVGWEVVGNYSGEVRNPERNLPLATGGSAVVIGVVTLTVAMAVQTLSETDGSYGAAPVSAVVGSLLAHAGGPLMALLTISLCVCTYLLFVGGVARLMTVAAGKGFLPSFVAIGRQNQPPYGAVLLLMAVHLTLLMAVHNRLLGLEQLVAIANGFFLANALIGVLAGVRLLAGALARAVASLLAILLLFLLLQSAWQILACIVGLAVAIHLRGAGSAMSNSTIP